MSSTKYNIQMENYPSHLASQFKYLLESQKFVDVTLKCDTHSLKAHKIVLVASSLYFQEHLVGLQGNILIKLEMKIEILKSLIEFIYCGKTEFLEENMRAVFSAGKFLKIKGLEKGEAVTEDLPTFPAPVILEEPPSRPVSQPMVVEYTSTPARPAGAASNRHPIFDLRIPIQLKRTSHQSQGDRPHKKQRKPYQKENKSSDGAWSSRLLDRATRKILWKEERNSVMAVQNLKTLTHKAQHYTSQDGNQQNEVLHAVNSIFDSETSADYHQYVTSDEPQHHEVIQGFDNDIIQEDSVWMNEDKPKQDVSQFRGLSADMPILFEMTDGSYVNISEDGLLNMPDSGNNKYTTIEHNGASEPMIQNGSKRTEYRSGGQDLVELEAVEQGEFYNQEYDCMTESVDMCANPDESELHECLKNLIQ